MNRITSLILLTALVASGMAFTSDEASHPHHHGDAAPLELQLDGFERWDTDEALRQGMGNIRTAFDRAYTDYGEDRFDHTGAAALADEVEVQVQFMFVNCALPPDADAELHKLLAAMLGAAELLRTDSDVHTGLHELHTALKTYGEYFDHPGWDG